ncbi:MAG: hypothetical protein G01um101470_87 [Parcubacteria group bacterium Gr01-1014_70]|nr:MAG: hypothetical protein G01um101470_87 [Parcubacteria group bacterium Gr01-1014_70]
MISKRFLIILLTVFVVTSVGASIFFISTKQPSPPQQTTPSPTSTLPTNNQVSPTTKQSTRTKVEYAEGQYIDGVWKVRERVQDCGGGEICLNYLVIQLPEEMSINDIGAIRINVNSCVDETLRTGDMARVRGIIEKVIPDIGLILSCNSSKTSVTKN